MGTFLKMELTVKISKTLPCLLFRIQNSFDKPNRFFFLFKSPVISSNKIELYPEEWEEICNELPFLLDDAQAYKEGNLPDFRIEGPDSDIDVSESQGTTQRTWTDVSLRMKRYLVKPLLFEMPDGSLFVTVAFRKYHLDEDKGLLLPKEGDHCLNLSLEEIVALINKREEINKLIDTNYCEFVPEYRQKSEISPLVSMFPHMIIFH